MQCNLTGVKLSVKWLLPWLTPHDPLKGKPGGAIGMRWVIID